MDLNVELTDVATKAARVRLARLGGANGPRLGGEQALFIHDVFASHRAFLPSFTGLKGPALALDLPGAGESEKPSARKFGYSVVAFADVVVDVVAGLRLGRVALVGHGLGAAIALACAAAHPAMVSKLVLVAPIVYEGRRATLERLARVPVVGPVAIKQIVGLSQFRRYFDRDVFAEGATVPLEHVRAHFDAFNTPAGREAALATLRATADRRATVAMLPRITKETLVIAGRLDRLVPPDHGRRLVRELPAARLAVLEAGHSPAEEDPLAFAATIGDFLWPAATPTKERAQPRSERPR